jgi:integral membrane sensor domain MASE1
VWALAIGIVYFLAARIGWALLFMPSGVAVFSPASGVAAGVLMAFGRRARPALVMGVVAGAVAANLVSDRNLWTGLFEGFCNAGEAVLLVWLLERWFGPSFAFSDLRRALGFFAAALLAAAASAFGGAAIMTSFHTAAPFWEVWRAWFLSDVIGITTTAPLVAGLVRMRHELPSRGELIAGLGLVSLMALLTAHMVTHPTDSWLSVGYRCCCGSRLVIHRRSPSSPHSSCRFWSSARPSLASAALVMQASPSWSACEAHS